MTALEDETTGQSTTADGAYERERAEGQRLSDAEDLRSYLRNWSSLITMVLTTVAGSVLIVIYVMVVNAFTLHKKGVDIVDDAALTAARDLSEITVEYASFGRVGLCDLDPNRMRLTNSAIRATGINSIKETLRIDQTIAEDLKNSVILHLVKKDEELASKAERELTARLRQAVQPDVAQTSVSTPPRPSDDQDNSVYKHVHRLIDSDRNMQNTTVKIFLGHAKDPLALTLTAESTIIPEANFVKGDDGKAPSLVLVETASEDKPKGPGQATLTTIRRRCATLPARIAPAVPAALIFNFPDGVPPSFRSAQDFLSNSSWQSKGDWQQAIGSQVPGKGSLAPPLEPILPSMSPGDAMAVALYHWLRTAGPDVSPERVVTLLKSPWRLDQLMGSGPSGIVSGSAADEQNLPPLNSCLARDTGAREYSIMNQSGPGSIGQLALIRAFSIYSPQPTINPGQRAYPSSALPLFVNQKGICNLAGRKGFDTKLVQEFLHSVYQTNLSAIETLASASIMIAQSNGLLTQIDQKIFIENQELSSVTAQLTRIDKQQVVLPKKQLALPVKQSGQGLTVLAQERIDALKKTIKEDEELRRRYGRMHVLAMQAHYNASKVATATYDLCTHTFKYCREGLFGIQSPTKGFLIGRQFIFMPFEQALTESDFYQAAMKETQPPVAFDAPDQRPAEARMWWLQKNMDAVVVAETAFHDPKAVQCEGGKTLRQMLDEKPFRENYPAGMVVLDSRVLSKSLDDNPVCSPYANYAFSNIPIPSGQLLYYCQDAIRTGTAPQVSWSVLMRDMVASKGDNGGEGAFGEPVPSSQTDWCVQDKKTRSQCPGLACEVQVRCPLPVLTAFPEDSYVKNPASNGQAPQIPPVPPDML